MILKGDCIEVMKAMKPNSIDAIVTDPPYGLEFMGKEWDKLWDSRKPKENKEGYVSTDGSIRKRNPVTSKVNLPNYKAGIEAQLWHTQWLTEAYRVLKPGGSMLVMGGTRTFHRLACAIEDSGFIIKDTLMWLYGSGFPKAQDLRKMIDKRAKAKRKVVGNNIRLGDKKAYPKNPTHVTFHTDNCPTMGEVTLPSTDLAKYWDGFKVGGIKPAYEPIIWAVKPPEGSYVDNVLKWGVGAVNVDECRIGLNNNDHKGKGGGGVHEHWVGKDMENRIYGKIRRTDVDHTKGRFPANIILDEEAGRMLDEQSGNLPNNFRKNKGVGKDNCAYFGNAKSERDDIPYNDNGGASRFFYCAKASRGERNAGLDDLLISGERQRGRQEKFSATMGKGIGKREHNPDESRAWVKNNHPTVKPIKLFEYLIKLVTREGQIVLDPFIGSGTTAIAAHNTGRKCVGIEKEDEYLEIATRRIDHWENKPKQNSLNLGE